MGLRQRSRVWVGGRARCMRPRWTHAGRGSWERFGLISCRPREKRRPFSNPSNVQAQGMDCPLHAAHSPSRWQGWISTLERKLEIAAESAHPDFRCFFSAEPINGAPQAKIVPSCRTRSRCPTSRPRVGAALRAVGGGRGRRRQMHVCPVRLK